MKMNTNEAKKIVIDAVKTRQAVDPFVEQDKLRSALNLLKQVTGQISKELWQAIETSKIFEGYVSKPDNPVEFGRPITSTMTWAEFAWTLTLKLPLHFHKMVNGVDTIRFVPRLAKGHQDTQKRGEIYISLDDCEKMRPEQDAEELKWELKWEAVVTDQMTGKGYHIQSAPCGAGYQCDALAWPLTKSEMKAYTKKQRAGRIAFIRDMEQAIIIADEDDPTVFYICDNAGNDIVADSEDGFKTKELAEQVLADGLRAARQAAAAGE